MFGLTGENCDFKKDKSQIIELPCKIDTVVYEIYNDYTKCSEYG